MKTLDENWIDWEGDIFGFGYGTGEPHTIPAVKRFFELCPESGAYDFSLMETGLGPVVAWMLINTLAHANILEYGTSPRYAWLTKEGRALKIYIESKSAQELIDLAAAHDENYIPCYPNVCNCQPEELKCNNPFWVTTK